MNTEYKNTHVPDRSLAMSRQLNLTQKRSLFIGYQRPVQNHADFETDPNVHQRVKNDEGSERKLEET